MNSVLYTLLALCAVFAAADAFGSVVRCPDACDQPGLDGGGMELAEDGVTCVDIDECSHPNWVGVCRSSCQNTPMCFECISAEFTSDYKMDMKLIMHDYAITYYNEATFLQLVAAEIGIPVSQVQMTSAVQAAADTEISFAWFAVDATNFVELITHVETIDWEGFLLEYMRDTLPAAGTD